MWISRLLLVSFTFLLTACSTSQLTVSRTNEISQDRKPEHGFRGRPNPMAFAHATDEPKFLVINGYTGRPGLDTCEGIASVVHVAHYSNETDFKITPRGVGNCTAKFFKKGDLQKSFVEQIIVKRP
jgi:hypothetical protein